MPIINGHSVETGCYIDGHWGQYGTDRLADIAEGFGWKAFHPTDDPREMRRVAEADPQITASWTEWYWEQHHAGGDAIEEWLNVATSNHDADGSQPGYIWHWYNGEFFLSPMCDDGDCDDETCIHWCD